MTMAQIFKDPHYAARANLVGVDDDKLGRVVMPAVIPKLSRTPGQVRHGAHGIDADRAEHTFRMAVVTSAAQPILTIEAE